MVRALAHVELDVLIVMPLGDIPVLVTHEPIQRQYIPGTLTLQPVEELPVVESSVVHGLFRRRC